MINETLTQNLFNFDTEKANNALTCPFYTALMYDQNGVPHFFVSVCPRIISVIAFHIIFPWTCEMLLIRNTGSSIFVFPPLNTDYVHPPGGWIYYFCFFRRPMSDVRCPASGVRCPASRMVSAHLKEKY